MEELKCILLILSEKRQSENVTYYMIPTIWHSGKVEIMETGIKISPMAWVKGRDEQVKYRFLGQWKYSVWYYKDVYPSLYIYQNP